MWEMLASDVFALGVTCFEMLTATHCFYPRKHDHDHDHMNMQQVICKGMWSYPVGFECSSMCADFIAKCLTLESHNRPTAAALLAFHPWLQLHHPTRSMDALEWRTMTYVPKSLLASPHHANFKTNKTKQANPQHKTKQKRKQKQSKKKKHVRVSVFGTGMCVVIQ